MISTPRKPIATAPRRRGDDHSPRSGPASRATIRGVANWIDRVSASWSLRRARKLRAVEPNSSSERRTWSVSRFVRATPGVRTGLRTISTSETFTA
jgi:hypothetical protein